MAVPLVPRFTTIRTLIRTEGWLTLCRNRGQGGSVTSRRGENRRIEARVRLQISQNWRNGHFPPDTERPVPPARPIAETIFSRGPLDQWPGLPGPFSGRRRRLADAQSLFEIPRRKLGTNAARESTSISISGRCRARRSWRRVRESGGEIVSLICGPRRPAAGDGWGHRAQPRIFAAARALTLEVAAEPSQCESKHRRGKWSSGRFGIRYVDKGYSCALSCQ